MINPKFNFNLLLSVAVIFVMGCVSQKKYDELLAEKVRMEGEMADLEKRLNAANTQIERLSEKINALENKNEITSEDLDSTRTALRNLNDEHKKLETLYENVLKNSGKLNRDLAQQQERLLEMQTRNEKLSSDLAEREKKVEELEKILADKEAAVQQLKERVSNALLDFGKNDLTVEIKNGKVYVSLAEQLLFESGSIRVDEKGRQALQQLAEALKDSEDINVMVEGHTDNVPISRTSQYMRDNWDLSVLRATTIVRILTNHGVKPTQITAAGKGEYSPVVENTTAENKQKNRRTEIILTPKLDELFQILESN